MTEDEANAAAVRLADVGYECEVEYQVYEGWDIGARAYVSKTGFCIRVLDNSGYREVLRDTGQVESALVYMADNGDLIAQGLPGRY